MAPHVRSAEMPAIFEKHGTRTMRAFSRQESKEIVDELPQKSIFADLKTAMDQHA